MTIWVKGYASVFSEISIVTNSSVLGEDGDATATGDFPGQTILVAAALDKKMCEGHCWFLRV